MISKMHKRSIQAALICLLSTSLWSMTIEICKDCTYSSIQLALDNIESGDTIRVKKGIYKSANIQIHKSVSILGESGARLVSLDGDELITILSDNVHVEGLEIVGVTLSYLKERAGIRVKRSRNFVIENNKINNCFFGVYIENSRGGIIANNEINGNATTEAESGNGVHAWHSSELNIFNNQISNHRDGIYFEFVNNSKISNNVSIENKRYGLHFMFSNNDEYFENIFSKNGVGVAVMFSKQIRMTKNSFTFNWGRASYGLLLKEINDAEISQNLFESNTVGIFVEGSNRVSYERNIFKSNGWAIKFSGGCSDNAIESNDFMYNFLDFIVGTTIDNNRIDGNYWSEYSGYDLDKNGVGDVPHHPVKLFAHILDQCSEAVVLQRSFFVDLLNFAEKVSPVFSSKTIKDDHPQMKPLTND